MKNSVKKYIMNLIYPPKCVFCRTLLPISTETPVLRPVIPVKFPCFNRTKKDREILTYFQAAKKEGRSPLLRCVCKLSPDLFVEFHFHGQRVED